MKPARWAFLPVVVVGGAHLQTRAWVQVVRQTEGADLREVWSYLTFDWHESVGLHLATREMRHSRSKADKN